MDSISITLEQMYAAQANSPNTELAGDLDTTSREITVVDASVLPAVPFLLTIGYDTATSETVLVTAAEGNTLTVTRGIDGPAQIWVAGVKCARIFTAKDLNDIQTNIETIKTALEEAQGDLSVLEYGKADQVIISGVEEFSIAANSYSAGQYLILSGVLYRVTAAITAGDTITDSGSGANVAAATVGSELTGLRNTLTQLDADKADEASLAVRRSGATNTGAQIETGTFFYLDGTLMHAIATIAQNASFTAQNCETVPVGGLNNIITSGSSNGWDYIRFVNGLIIARKSVSLPKSIADSTLTTGVYVYSFPNNATPFSMANYQVFISGHTGNSDSFAGAIFKDSTFFNFVSYASINEALTFVGDFILIGTPN